VKTMNVSRRIAASAIGTALLAVMGTATAHAGSDGLITFDEIQFDGVLTTIAADHYLNQGVLFGDTPHLVDITLGQPDQIPQFVAGGGSLNNVLVLANSINQTFIDLFFVAPGTTAPAVTSWFSVLAFDTDIGTQLGAIEAYDIDGNLLGFADAVTDESFVGTLSLEFEGIHRIRLITDADGNMFDNIAFGALQAVSPGDIPAPGVLALMAIAGLAGRRRRRA